jgi:hypothetical protein
MIINLAGVKASLDTYQLTNPWTLLIITLLISIISGFFVCSSDEKFKESD